MSLYHLMDAYREHPEIFNAQVIITYEIARYNGDSDLEAMRKAKEPIRRKVMGDKLSEWADKEWKKLGD